MWFGSEVRSSKQEYLEASLIPRESDFKSILLSGSPWITVFHESRHLFRSAATTWHVGWRIEVPKTFALAVKSRKNTTLVKGKLITIALLTVWQVMNISSRWIINCGVGYIVVRSGSLVRIAPWIFTLDSWRKVEACRVDVNLWVTLQAMSGDLMDDVQFLLESCHIVEATVNERSSFFHKFTWICEFYQQSQDFRDPSTQYDSPFTWVMPCVSLYVNC